MTRPQIIRADTIDLQDKTSPTAQDHSRQPQHPAPLGAGPAAPHQQASLRQVEDERHSEELHLEREMWSEGNSLRDEPASDDDQPVVDSANGDHAQRDEQAVRLNGGGDEGEGEGRDADDEDMDDDDMMGGISSSPSIDDGALPSLPQFWPARGSSLTPTSSPLSQSPFLSSSPFIDTPIHLPLSVPAARRQIKVPAISIENIPISSYRSSPIPFLSPSLSKQHSPSFNHHHRGEYTWKSNTNFLKEPGSDHHFELSRRTGHLLRVEDRLQCVRSESNVSLLSDLDDDEIQSMLQPVRSPTEGMSDDPFDVPQRLERISEEDDGWTTDSDADSWDEEAGDDDGNDDFFSDDPRFVDSGWGGECLRETEDIDFEFVYALHTFVATVEGQANATKGDTMVLLDDSNSYWWLVRVVKDSSIGYLPAEHIETPTERLARLNKHRNIDLSMTMLGDTNDKPKNPLKKAIRRRNAKNVQFAAENIFFEASDYDYSSDEGGDDELFGGVDPNETQAQGAAEKSDVEQDNSLKVEPLKVHSVAKEPNAADGESARSSSDDPAAGNSENRTSDEMFDTPLDQKISRNGTLRNTDSFFKDDTAETRKITLTPNLLRDDSSSSTTGSKERERAPSLESLEKNGFADKVKDEKKKKEKKSGMLSGLFKRKEKKPKSVGLDSMDDDAEKQSEEFGRSSPQSKDSSEERPSSAQSGTSPQRQPSKGKLQKPPRARDESPSKVTKSILKTDDNEREPGAMQTLQTMASKEALNIKPTGSQIGPSASLRMVAPEQEDSTIEPPAEPAVTVQSVHSPDGRSRTNSAASKLNPMNMLYNQTINEGPRPEKVKKAKERVQLDDFDSEEEKNDPFADPNSNTQPTPQAAETVPGRLSESPVQISVTDAQSPEKERAQQKEQEPDPNQPPGLTADTSSQEDPSPATTPTLDDRPSTTAPSRPTITTSHPSGSPSPTLLHPSSSLTHPSRPAPFPREVGPSPPVSSESMSLPPWSDASLRTYLDDTSDIRDTLMVINDTTGVKPVGPDHPLMAQLFVEETKAVTQLGGELDLLLANWLEAKRKRHRGLSPAK